MITGVFLSDNYVQVVTGEENGKTVQVRSLYHFLLPAGCMLNGVFVDKEAFIETIRQIWENYNLPRRDIKLIINSSMFKSRLLELPPLNHAKTVELIKKEYGDLENIDTYYFDYMQLQDKIVRDTADVQAVDTTEDKKSAKSAAKKAKSGTRKVRNMVATSVSKEYIEDFIQIFDSIGIRLSSISGFLANEIKVLGLVPGLRNQTYIYQILYGNQITNVLFENGSYIYSNRTRVFSDPGSDSFGVEVAQNINSMIQFFFSRKSEYALNTVFLGGYDPESFEICKRSVSALSMNVLELDLGEIVAFPDPQFVYIEDETAYAGYNFLCVLGSLFTNPFGEDINFYAASQEIIKKQKKDKQKAQLKKIIPPIAVLAVMLLVCLGMGIKNFLMQRELDDLTAFTQDANNIAMAAQSDMLLSQNTQMKSYLNMMDSAWAALDTYPRANSRVQEQLVIQAGDAVAIEFESYDSSTGILSLLATATNVEDINVFIKKLETMDLFAQLDYSGYTYNDGESTYTINVDCYLAQNAGR